VDLVDRVCASLPAALSADCTRLIDEEARTRVEVDRILDAFIGDGSYASDQGGPVPESRGEAASKPIDLSVLPSAIAAAAVHDPLVAAGLQANLNDLRGKRAVDLSASLAEVLASQVPKAPRRGRKPVHSGELDLPVTITDQDKGSPNIWETYKICLEAKLSSLQSLSKVVRSEEFLNVEDKKYHPNFIDEESSETDTNIDNISFKFKS
jgi:hypothetical protein